MKRWIVILLCFVSLCSMAACEKSENNDAAPQDAAPQETFVNYANMQRADSFAGGDGTKQFPYQISTAGQLARLADIGDYDIDDEELGMEYEERKAAKSAYYVLVNDIEINNTSSFDDWKNTMPDNIWKPINNFEGSFDGQGHRIIGMYVTSYDPLIGSNHSGLFGEADDAIISNLIIENAFVTGTLGGTVVCCGRNTDINNCQILNAYICCSLTAGGIIHDGNDCDISNCEVDGEIILSGYRSGGIAGEVWDSRIQNCISHMSMNAESAESSTGAGGIIGCMYNSYDGSDAKVIECSFDGEIKGNVNPAGGICGDIYAGRNTSIQNCENTAVIETTSEQGITISSGICGALYAFEDAKKEAFTRIGGCINNGVFNNTVKVNNVAGILGYANIDTGKIVISNCRNLSDIDNAEYAGGIVGNLDIMGKGDITLENLENKGNISGDNIGGIGGNTTCAPWRDSSGGSLILRNCKNKGTLSTNHKAGGLFCSFMPGITADTPIGTYKIENCSSIGDYPYFARTDSLDVLGEILIREIAKEYGVDAAKKWVKTAFPDYKYKN